jgi:hypothetical protein
MFTVGNVAVPVVLSVVNAPVDAVPAPTGVPSIAPPLMSTLMPEGKVTLLFPTCMFSVDALGYWIVSSSKTLVPI